MSDLFCEEIFISLLKFCVTCKLVNVFFTSDVGVNNDEIAANAILADFSKLCKVSMTRLIAELFPDTHDRHKYNLIITRCIKLRCFFTLFSFHLLPVVLTYVVLLLVMVHRQPTSIVRFVCRVL